IGGFAELLESGAGGELSEQGSEYVRAILESVGRLGEQIETLLDLSQSEAGLLPLDLEEIDFFPFIAALVREREKAICERGLSLDLKGSEEIGSFRADRRRIGRAIGHVIDNAINATEEGGRILVDLARLKAGVRIVVSDNGRGLTHGEAARALEGFKISDGGKTVDRRQGLGLPLARQLVEAHGGKLKLISEKGVGTTVSIVIP
ncbi:MAG TPA: HAMP domain-containing sensor histidine kinase, partial [Sphingomonadaceae bacterium]|nr:HAMP domain-containing sensor histidine kinase [Sphingomonadaceae bacterium]